MKLRTHLVVLVLSAILPLLGFSAVMGAIFWYQQRRAYDERFLERVRALAIGLDRELEGHARALQVLSQSSISLQAGDVKTFYEEALRVRAEQPAWSTVVLADRTGAQLMNLQRPLGTPLPRVSIDESLIETVVTTGRPAVSGLVRDSVGGLYATNVVVTVRRAGAVSHLVIALIEPRVWLELLARYPMASAATMTLLDQHGLIIARTLNNDRWVGKPPAPGLTAAVRRSPEGAYRNVGLEGQLFYAAHSPVATSSWTLATGVPAEDVERALWGSTITLTAGATLVTVLAVGLAVVFGRRIARPVADLSRSVASLAAGEPPPPLPEHAPHVDEVTEVARAFEQAAARLSAREAALRESEERFREIAAERARLLDNERAARAEAETANRLKDEFLAVLSHELRTPINAVFGWARLLRGAKAEADTVEHGLEVIERNAAAQVKLIEDLLDVSRIITGKMRVDVRLVDVAAAVDNAIESVRHAAEMKGIRLESMLDARAGPVAGDPDRLRQVVWNLLSNAIKFTPRGGRVQVRLSRAHSRVALVVSDTGAGITPDLLPHIFERFRQGDSTSTRQHGGLGLGLALVKHIVELHGGTVHAESAGEGQGATFRVELPASPGGAPAPVLPAPSTASVALPSVSLRGVRVLVVDDDQDSLDLFTRLLAETGAELRTAASVAEAMAIFRAWRPEVLVSDVEMPDEDGYSLIRRIRALPADEGGEIPAVAVTAYGRVSDRVRLLSAGYTMHVPKPVEPAELIVVLAAVARRAGTDGGGPA
jgi:signal transduction histidine kinase/CheY-like chemotaxis protein